MLGKFLHVLKWIAIVSVALIFTFIVIPITYVAFKEPNLESSLESRKVAEIKFRYVDEECQPIKNKQLTVIQQMPPTAPYSGGSTVYGNHTTDENGNFSVSQYKAYNLKIIDPALYPSLDDSDNFPLFQYDADGLLMSHDGYLEKITASGNPIVIYPVQRSQGSDLIKYRVTGGYIDDITYFYDRQDFVHLDVGRALRIGVDIYRDEAREGAPFVLRVTPPYEGFEPDGGGIMDVTDLYENLPDNIPSAGYVSLLDYVLPATWEKPLKKTFYFHGMNKSLVGLLSLEYTEKYHGQPTLQVFYDFMTYHPYTKYSNENYAYIPVADRILPKRHCGGATYQDAKTFFEMSPLGEEMIKPDLSLKVDRQKLEYVLSKKQREKELDEINAKINNFIEGSQIGACGIFENQMAYEENVINGIDQLNAVNIEKILGIIEAGNCALYKSGFDSENFLKKNRNITTEHLDRIVLKAKKDRGFSGVNFPLLMDEKLSSETIDHLYDLRLPSYGLFVYARNPNTSPRVLTALAKEYIECVPKEKCLSDHMRFDLQQLIFHANVTVEALELLTHTIDPVINQIASDRLTELKIGEDAGYPIPSVDVGYQTEYQKFKKQHQLKSWKDWPLQVTIHRPIPTATSLPSDHMLHRNAGDFVPRRAEMQDGVVHFYPEEGEIKLSESRKKHRNEKDVKNITVMDFLGWMENSGLWSSMSVRVIGEDEKNSTTLFRKVHNQYEVLPAYTNKRMVEIIQDIQRKYDLKIEETEYGITIRP